MKPWQEAYEKRYKAAKERGRSFFPYAVFKDALVALIVFGVLSYLAIHFGAKLEELADPTDTTYNPRPEWYFLFLFQALKAFPGSLESVAAVVLPGAAILLLIAVPFMDSGPLRHPLNRPFWTALGIFAAGGVATLTFFGLRSPLLNPTQERNPQVMAGKRLFSELNCAYCHRINGKGGKVGPDLAAVAGTRSDDWLKAHFRNPKAVSPGSVMPKLNLLPEEIDDLTAYVQSLGTGGPYSPEAPKLFAADCEVCHTMHGKGADIGPDLSHIGAARERGFIKNYIMNPANTKPDSIMPSFKGQLTGLQIEDLTRYLAHQR